jgi:filamentous hemagglutinin
MANIKISALTSATTPLAGTEVLPIVQSSATTKVSVANLTVGRAVSALSFASTTGARFATSSGNVGIGATAPTFKLDLGFTDTSIGWYLSAAYSASLSYITASRTLSIATTSADSTDAILFSTGVTSTQRMGISSAGNITFNTGNLIQGTAARGVNFTANTPAAGMTSQLLNWYEEGTWTPNQGAGLTLVGAFSSTGRYTRIGRQVCISGTVTGATSVAVTAAAGVITSNLPFTVGTAGHGNATNTAVNVFAAVICTSTNVTSAGAIAATGTITFSATYFV